MYLFDCSAGVVEGLGMDAPQMAVEDNPTAVSSKAVSVWRPPHTHTLFDKLYITQPGYVPTGRPRGRPRKEGGSVRVTILVHICTSFNTVYIIQVVRVPTGRPRGRPRKVEANSAGGGKTDVVGSDMLEGSTGLISMR